MRRQVGNLKTKLEQ